MPEVEAVPKIFTAGVNNLRMRAAIGDTISHNSLF
jgi:hypothetical protein